MTTAVMSGLESKIDEDGLQDSNEAGLVDAHAYSIIAAIDVEIGVMRDLSQD